MFVGFLVLLFVRYHFFSYSVYDQITIPVVPVCVLLDRCLGTYETCYMSLF
jgi:hypothetical protein